MRILRRLKDERGIGLITAIMASFVVTLLVTVALALSLHSSTQSAYDRRRVQSVSAAEAGIDYYLSHLQSVPPSGVQCSMTGTLTATPTSRYVVTPTFYNSLGQVMACPFPVGTLPTAVRIQSVGTSSDATPARTMEAYADLVAEDGSPFAEVAFFSNETPVLKSNVQIYGNGLNDGDLYTNGNLTMSSNSVIYGSAFAQGTLTMSNNNEIKGDAWSGGALQLGPGSIVRGDAISSTSSVSVPAGTVYGDAKAGTSITVSGKGKIIGTRTPNTPSAAPPTKSFPEFTYVATDWITAGYSIQTFSVCSTAAALLNNLPAGNVVIRITVPCELVISGTVTAKGNLAIISDGPIRMSAGSSLVTDGPSYDLFLVAGLAKVAPCDFTMQANSSFGAGMNTFIYTPCTITLGSNGLVFRGQLIANKIVMNSNSSLNYVPVTVPGNDATGGFAENIQYTREIKT